MENKCLFSFNVQPASPLQPYLWVTLSSLEDAAVEMHLIITAVFFYQKKDLIDLLIKSAVLRVPWKSSLSFLYYIWAEYGVIRILVFNVKFIISRPVTKQIALEGPWPLGACCSPLWEPQSSPERWWLISKDFFSLADSSSNWLWTKQAAIFPPFRKCQPERVMSLFFLCLCHISQTEEGKCHLADKDIFTLTIQWYHPRPSTPTTQLK